MTDQEFAEILALKHELSGLEFKGPGSASDKPFFANVVKAMLGMANRRDGGRVVIGVNESGGKADPVGLNNLELNTWKYDDVASKLAEYADPSITFDLECKQHDNKNYVVIHVREFDETPVLCKKPYERVLRQGACYVRSRRKPETTELPTQEDMRDLLDLAAEKRLRKHLELTKRAGGVIVPLTGVPTPSEQTTAEALFEKQLSDLK